MCLIGLAYRHHPRYPLLVAANRDEFHGRPTAPARFWEERPRLLAGRDLEAGGTWLGLSLDGRFAAVTNYREPASRTSGERSRGELVRTFLEGTESAPDYCARVTREGDRYGGFSLLVMDGDSFWFASNRGGEPFAVSPGVHGLSNEQLDTPWPKVNRIRAVLADQSAAARPDRAALLEVLHDSRGAPDAELPDTGVGLERERLLSAPFIVDNAYGTRCTTLVALDADGGVDFEELSFGPEGAALFSRRYRFGLPGTGARDPVGGD